MATELRVAVQAEGGVSVPIDVAVVESAVESVLRAEGVAAGEVSVTFVGDDEIAKLNEEYLSHEGPTDVISFPLHLPGDPPLGDVYVGFHQAARQAAENGVPMQEELLRLAIHGVLHILGYEHPEGDERLDSPMYRRQEELLAAVLRSGSQAT